MVFDTLNLPSNQTDKLVLKHIKTKEIHLTEMLFSNSLQLYQQYKLALVALFTIFILVSVVSQYMEEVRLANKSVTSLDNHLTQGNLSHWSLHSQGSITQGL